MRIAPADPPFSRDIESRLNEVMPRGMRPLILFTTLARDGRLFEKFMSGGLLDKGNLTLRQREIVILRTTALSRSDYEWGVHVAVFAAKAGFSAAELRSLAMEQADITIWSDDESLLIGLCNELHATCSISEPLWSNLTRAFSSEAILEMLMLAGFYRTVAYLTNGLELPLEPGTSGIGIGR